MNVGNPYKWLKINWWMGLFHPYNCGVVGPNKWGYAPLLITGRGPPCMNQPTIMWFDVVLFSPIFFVLSITPPPWFPSIRPAIQNSYFRRGFTRLAWWSRVVPSHDRISHLMPHRSWSWTLNAFEMLWSLWDVNDLTGTKTWLSNDVGGVKMVGGLRYMDSTKCVMETFGPEIVCRS